MARRVRDVLVRNTAFNTAGRLWEAAINIALAAYIVPRVGLAGWGLWVLVGVFTGYVALLDFGMSSGFARYIAEYAARNEREKISAVVSTGVFVYAVMGAVLILLLMPLIDPLIVAITWLAPDRPALRDPVFLADVRLLLRGGVILFACSNCISALTSVQTGLQRMGITNAIGFACSLVKVAAIAGFLETGHGVRGLLYAQAMVLAVFAVLTTVAAYWLVPGLRISARGVTREMLAGLFQFGWKTQVVRLCTLVAFQTDKLVVGIVYKHLDLVGVYRIGEELASKMRQAPVMLLSALVPAAAELDARAEDERLRDLYLRSTKYVAAVAVPLTAFMAGGSGFIIRAWMGNVPDLDTAAWVNRILAVGYLANVLPGAGVGIILGKNRPGFQMTAGIIEMVANVSLTVLLVLTIGFYGVPLGTALAMGLSCAWFLRAMRAVIGVGPGQLLRNALLWPACAALPGFVLCAAADVLTAAQPGRLVNGGALLACMAAVAASYTFLLYVSPFFDAFDRDFLRQSMRFHRSAGGPVQEAAHE